MSIAEYISKFDELPRYAPHMVTTTELKVHQFIQGLKKTIVRDLKVGGTKGVSFVEIANRALYTEKDILDEERVIRERQAREALRNSRSGY